MRVTIEAHENFTGYEWIHEYSTACLWNCEHAAHLRIPSDEPSNENEAVVWKVSSRVEICANDVRVVFVWAPLPHRDRERRVQRNPSGEDVAFRNFRVVKPCEVEPMFDDPDFVGMSWVDFRNRVCSGFGYCDYPF